MQVEGEPVRGESAGEHVRRAVHALAQAVDEPFRKTVVAIGAGALHLREVTIAPVGTKRGYGRIPTVESA